MARAAQKSDFPIDVEGVGAFVFGRRTMADEIRIHVEYARLTEAVPPTPWLDQVATWLSTLKVMTVRFPQDFDVETLDPLDQETYNKLMKVHTALVAKESSFRRGSGEASKAGGKASGENS